MNERIKQLAEQAHEYTDRAIYSSGWSNGDEIFEENFAELIIQECAILADQYQFERNIPNPRRVEPLPLVPSDFILQHFGVKS